MSASRPSRAALVAAFAAVYVIWGSTYLAIRFAIETLPPFLMASARFLLAGALLYGWARWRGAARPTRREWAGAATVGLLLLLGGNGGVVWAEQRVPSGIAALIVSTVPLWVVVVDAIRPGGNRPRPTVVVGVLIGLVGVALLVGPGALGGGGTGTDLAGAGVLLVASLSWAFGSVISRSLSLPGSPPLATGMEMFAGGTGLLLAGLLAGEPSRLDLAAVTTASWTALGYLVVFGSLIGFSAYVWLLKVVDTAKVATYAYVNPVVAMALGWALADEPVTARTLAAAAVILAAVALITTVRSRPRVTPEPAERPREDRAPERDLGGAAAEVARAS